MNKEQVIATMESINRAMKDKQKEVFDRYAKDGKINIDDYFKVVSETESDTRCEFRMMKDFQDYVRKQGWDIKMNMQYKRLIFCGRI